MYKTTIATVIFYTLCNFSVADDLQPTAASTSRQQQELTSNSVGGAYVANASNFVEKTSEKVMEIVRSSKSKTEKETELTSIFMGVMDVDWMGKFAIGRYWQQLDDQSKISYLEAYRAFLIASYIPSFRKYNGQKFEVLGIKDIGDEQIMVQSDIRLDGSNSKPYKIEYRLKEIGNSFKIRDIVAEGVSLMTTQRADFASIMSNGGIDALQKELISRAVQK